MEQPTGSTLRRESFEDGTFGAWVLTCDPVVYDLGPDFERGAVDGWWPVGAPTADRRRLMAAGQPALLWVHGSSSEFPPGFWAVGRLTGPVRGVGLVGADGVPGGRRGDGFDVPVELDIVDPPVLAEDLDGDVVLDRLEVRRRPSVTLSWLTRAQLAALADFAVVPPGLATGTPGWPRAG